MPLPDDILQIENEYVARGGKPALGRAYAALKREWAAGNRDREVGLHLLFLSWFCYAEPACLTGLPTSPGEIAVFHTVLSHFDQEIESDPEMLYVVGLMTDLFPWIFGDQSLWEARSRVMQQKYRALAPAGISPEIFSDRGAYGAYFMGHARLAGGY